MCTELYVKDGNHWIEQARELAALVGRENILWWPDDETADPMPEPDCHKGDDLSFCLCPVAIEATMERAGYTIESGWEKHSCDYVAYLSQPPKTIGEER